LAWAGQTAKTAIYVRRVTDQQFTVFAVNCTHLGCPVNWRDGANLFMCPCHGGVYYADGTVSAGPPPRALPQYPVRVHDGQVEIQTSPIPIA
ncbi:MAG: ubiquinol-cytochrome c reductase iron-sulfur subunit, partial [Gemmatimonadales bacterium]